jgi:hypothetical protein
MIRQSLTARATSVATLSLAAAAVFAPRSAEAATISTWNVGSGQYQDNFQFTQDAGFTGGALELGLRTVYRQSATLVPASGDTYTALKGPQELGVVGAIANNAARNRWNFDYHIYYAGGVQNLDSLTLTITSPAGNTVTGTGVFDMKVANNDNVPTNSGSDNDQDLNFYIQDSQNPVFDPWFVPTFNMEAQGLYTFTLTAIEGSSTLTQTMNVNVVPEPASVAILGLGVGALLLRRRRRTA